MNIYLTKCVSVQLCPCKSCCLLSYFAMFLRHRASRGWTLHRAETSITRSYIMLYIYNILHMCNFTRFHRLLTVYIYNMLIYVVHIQYIYNSCFQYSFTCDVGAAALLGTRDSTGQAERWGRSTLMIVNGKWFVGVYQC